MTTSGSLFSDSSLTNFSEKIKQFHISTLKAGLPAHPIFPKEPIRRGGRLLFEEDDSIFQLTLELRVLNKEIQKDANLAIAEAF